MLTHFPVGPNEDQCYLVAYMVPGTKVASIVLEHLNEQTAISEARRLNQDQAAREAATKAHLALLNRCRISNDLGGVI